MHVHGVKQEHPEHKRAMPGANISGPLTMDVIVRNENNTRIAKMSREDPHKVIGIINSLVTGSGGTLYVDTTVHDANRNRVLKLDGERDTSKIVKILNSLIKKSAVRKQIAPAEESTECEGLTEVVSS